MTLASSASPPLSIEALRFERPEALNASAPAETRGMARDDVRMLVSTASGHHDRRFRDLPAVLRPGDVVVVNRSATLPASLPASGAVGSFRLHLSTRYGEQLWLAEPRWSAERPGPIPMEVGDRLDVAGVPATAVARHPALTRLWFISFAEPIEPAMRRHGSPIHYAYLQDVPELEAFQTVFADLPGSAEMPSAARPFTQDTLRDLATRGVAVAGVTLHTGVSSLDVEAATVDEIELYAEPFEVPADTAATIRDARARGHRIVAVGTTVIRALESAVRDGHVEAARGFTRRVVRPGRHHGVADALLTGLHDSATSHVAMLFAFAGRQAVMAAYEAAIERGYLWHEFGDVHLLWRDAAGPGVRPGSDRAP